MAQIGSNEHGFAILEALISFSLLIMTLMAINAVTVHQTRIQVNVATNSGFFGNELEVELALGMESNCSNILLGQTFDPDLADGNPVVLRYPDALAGSPFIQAGMMSLDRSVTWTSVRLMPVAQVGTMDVWYGGPPSVSYAVPLHLARLRLEARREGDSPLGSPFLRSEQLQIYLGTSGHLGGWASADQILFCFGAELWKDYQTCVARKKKFTYTPAAGPPATVGFQCL